MAGERGGWGVGCGVGQTQGWGLYLFIVWGPGQDPFILPSRPPSLPPSVPPSLLALEFVKGPGRQVGKLFFGGGQHVPGLEARG